MAQTEGIKSRHTVSDFLIVPVNLPPLQSFPTPATHYFYIRPDAPPTPTKDTPRSLFVANVPVDANEAEFRAFFKDICGAVVNRVAFEGDTKEDVLASLGLRGGSTVTVRGTQMEVTEPYTIAGRKRKRHDDADGELAAIADEMRLPDTWERRTWKSGSSAVVVFVDRASAELAMKTLQRAVRRQQAEPLTWPTTSPAEFGEQRYRAHHALTYPPRRELQQRVNHYLSAFAALEEQRAKLLAKQRSEPDEDGFVTVTRGGRNAPARLDAAKEVQERHRERERKNVKTDFYRFQTREVRKQRERQLREKFEEDRRKVQKMRERRGKIRPE